MTAKDYSTIQRQLGLIEGITFKLEVCMYDLVFGAIETIQEILDKEMVGDAE